MYIEQYCHLEKGGLVPETKLHDYLHHEILTDNSVMKRQLDMLDHCGSSDKPLIICGEKGCGKGMIAQYAHMSSARRTKPLLKINCAYMTDEQIVLKLFGSRNRTSESLLTQASGATLYVENVNLMSQHAQSKLITYITSEEGSKTDIRYFFGIDKASSTTPMLTEAMMLHFDTLFFDIPPLRQRPEDILLLTLQQLQKIKQEYQIERLLSPGVMEAVLSYEWPGNIRQLINTIDRMAFFSNTTLIDSVSVFQSSLSSNSQFYTPKQVSIPCQSSKSLKELTLEYEVMIINQYIEEYGSLRKAAAALQTSPSVLSSKITKYNTSSSKFKTF